MDTIKISRDGIGRFVVADDRRRYGAYRTPLMAEYRAAQVRASRRPRPGRRHRAGA